MDAAVQMALPGCWVHLEPSVGMERMVATTLQVAEVLPRVAMANLDQMAPRGQRVATARQAWRAAWEERAESVAMAAGSTSGWVDF